MRGLSLQKLATVLGDPFNKQLLHRLENGSQNPDSQQLARLSNVLGQPVDFFLKPLKVSMGQIDFRKTQKVGKKATDRIIEVANDYFERYLELEDFLGVNQNKNMPLQNVKLSLYNPEGIIREAIKIRETIWEVGLDPLASIVHILEEKGIKVFVIDELDGLPLDTSFSGFSTVINENVGCIVINGNSQLPLVRKRFTLLHEFAHLYLNLQGMENREAEKLCDGLAGAILLPKQALLNAFGEKRTSVHFNELKLFKRTYGASLSSILYALYSNGVISQSYFTSCIIEYNAIHKKDENKGYEGNEHSDRFQQLLLRALITGIISESKAAALMNMKVAQFSLYLDNMFNEDSGN
jgi:Zn-dependent peptidase ImmA (M78 family)